MRKVLYVCHNHPKNSPGGAEQYAYELFLSVRDSDEFEAIFVSKVGAPMSIETAPEGTRFGLIDGDPSEYYIHTEGKEFDQMTGTARRKQLYTEDWRAFLLSHKPDIVHFHHNMFLGYDMIRETRRTLPNAAILYTLHEFVSICYHNGQMIRKGSNELCPAASPRRCHECFPQISSQSFFLRERFIKSAFGLVDMFITPSEHARQRYVAWGLPPEKVVHEDYGRIPVAPARDPAEAGHRRRIGFFGQFTKFKGVDVLLEAMKILEQQKAGIQLLLRGANLERTDPKFQQKIHDLLEETAGSVLFTGRYEQAELPGLLSAVDWVVVPSIWWETGPLVIHEALMHRRPVICSDIGSMLERIDDGVNGLHFRVGDPDSLARTLRYAVETPGLWDEIRGRITDPHRMEDHLPVMFGIYNELLDRAGAKVPA
jgi:glycosyltransferase involved in cell wall biosynthesis